jgi:hypothetical protein
MPETRGKTSPITGAYKPSIYIIQAWHRKLLLMDEWDDDMKIFDLDWNKYDYSDVNTRGIGSQLCQHQCYP